MITYERLVELLEYKETLGDFIWKVNKARAKAGDIAGYSRTDKYKLIKIDGQSYLVHRLVWLYVYGEWPMFQIDHIDRDPANNKIDNLRDVTQSVNQRNIGLRRNNKSGYTGICWQPRDNKWQVHIRTGVNKVKSIGQYTELEEAVMVRKQAEEDYGY